MPAIRSSSSKDKGTCPDCNKYCPSNLNRHKAIHLPPGARNLFHCEWPGCDKTGTQRGNLEAHVRKVHTGERILCPLPSCPENFRTWQRSQLTRHMQEKHGRKPTGNGRCRFSKEPSRPLIRFKTPASASASSSLPSTPSSFASPATPLEWDNPAPPFMTGTLTNDDNDPFNMLFAPSTSPNPHSLSPLSNPGLSHCIPPIQSILPSDPMVFPLLSSPPAISGVGYADILPLTPSQSSTLEDFLVPARRYPYVSLGFLRGEETDARIAGQVADTTTCYLQPPDSDLEPNPQYLFPNPITINHLRG